MAQIVIEKCRSCGRPIYWGVTKNGKACPYDAYTDEASGPVSHFTTCPDASKWSKKK